jgi:MoxR-like ATPase
MPSDITGTDILQIDNETGRRTMTFAPGPIFANVVLADEINRTPPKTQAALLEVMQEHRVTVQGRVYPLQEPFHVFATQNPIELEGTYPLPEAQLDRFMFEIVVDYLSEDDEVQVVRSTTAPTGSRLRPIITGEELRGFQQLVRRVTVSDAVARYAVNLTRASRPSEASAPDEVKRYVAFGASVRAPQQLILAGKARALMHGRYHVGFEDVRALARPVLRHRIIMNFHAQSERVTTDNIIERLLKTVPVPSGSM